jgi:predicted O-methyltransferase YrrM
MYSFLRLAGKYIPFYLRASSAKGHGVHSPFVYDFIREVLNTRSEHGDFQEIEALRRELLASSRVLDIEDFGAGADRGLVSQRSVADLTQKAAKSPKWGQLLMRIVQHYRPSRILELGTSLGISAAYLACGNPAARLISVEGSPCLAAEAAKHLRDLGLANAEVVTGHFDAMLPDLLAHWNSIDLVFVDGNHRKGPTLNYFHLLLPHLSPTSILVFDDIHWSQDMEEAWLTIQRDSRVLLSVDLFVFGLVFFNPQFREKQNFKIRF